MRLERFCPPFDRSNLQESVYEALVSGIHLRVLITYAFEILGHEAVGILKASFTVRDAFDERRIIITYAHDEKVRSKWSEYYKALCIHNPSEEQCREIEDKRDAMLKAMAASLGYKDEVSQNALDAKYIPKGMVDAITQNRAQQANYDALLREAALRFLTDQPFPKL